MSAAAVRRRVPQLSPASASPEPRPSRSVPNGRRFLVSGCGTSATTLPGLSMFCGSKIRFTSRNTSYSGPYCRRTNGVRLRPPPCSPLIVPPTASTSSIEFVGQSLHLAHVGRIGQIRGTAGRATARGRRGRRTSRDLVGLQHVLQADQKIGQHLGRHGNVFDERRRPLEPLHAIERWRDAPRQPAKDVVTLPGPAPDGSQTPAACAAASE